MRGSGDYISRKTAIEAFDDPAVEWNYGDVSPESVIRVIEQIPDADVRHVVLCRDCVHFQQFRPHDGFCKIDGMLWDNDFFCANGKREES